MFDWRIGNFFGFRSVLEQRIKLEETKNKLQAAVGPERYPVMLKIVEHRRAVSKSKARYWDIAEMTELEAIESVLMDVMYGYLS